MKRILAVAVAALALGGLLAACDDDDNGDDSTTTTTEQAADTTTTSSAASGDATVAVAETSLGEVLVDGEGLTLYLFEQDQGTQTACTDACASVWPALTSNGAPTAGEDIDAALLGVAEQADGSSQVTYNGHLLYTYAQDSAPGDTNGQGVGDVWFAVTPAGEAVSG